MSINREDFGELYEVESGTTKVLESVIIDPDTGGVKDLSDTNVYATGIVQILKPDGTQIGEDMIVIFQAPRTAGIVTFTVTNTHSAVANAGNWTGKIIFKNISTIIIDQKKFNLNILQ